MTAPKTPLPPEPDWIETLRTWYEEPTRPPEPSLWPLLCDVVEAARVAAVEYQDDNPFIGYSIEAQDAALAALRDEVERDG